MNKLTYLLTAIIVTFSFSSASAEGHWGVVAGVNISNFKFKQELFSHSTAVGATVGIKGDLPLGSIGLGVDAGLLYTQYGAKLNMSEKKIWEEIGNGRLMTHNLEIPIHFRYVHQRMNGFENTLAPFSYVGPAFDIHLGSSNNPAWQYAGMAISLQFGLGVRIVKKFELSAQYDLGATYVMKDKTLSDVSAQNRVWHINFVYYFK